MVNAYILVNLEGGEIPNVRERLIHMKGVTDANELFGEYDLIVHLDALTTGDIGKLVAKIRSLFPEIAKSQTMIVKEDAPQA